ncbi:PP2C family serine/threonine-protein phosphatase [Streptomyces sp. NPDC096132]|uniref:PP2C family serine/threonine-protein phosphatase n=1 Tax=Streptomyces sp. NPDC096132 TaxID=3366075 RepID=UPI00382CBF23
MSQQGGRPTGPEDDWWGQLYDDSTADMGPAPTADSLDDRFASAAGAVRSAGPADTVPQPRTEQPVRDGQPADWWLPEDPAPGAGPGSGPGPGAGAEPGPGASAAQATVPPPRNGTTPTAETARDTARAPADAPPADATPEPPAPADAAPAGPAPETPPSPVPNAFPPGPLPPGFPHQAPADPAPEAPPADAPTVSVSGTAGPLVPTETPEPRTATALDLPVLRDRPKAYVGSRPPTYDAEPTALPPADPDRLDDLVADTVLDGARYGTCALRAASVRGDSARYRGEPRRDSLLTARFGTGAQALLLVAMATGARATPGAHRAAAEACQWIGRAVGRSHVRLAQDIRAGRRGDLKSGLHRLTDRSLGRLRASAAEQGLEPDEYTATLRCLLLPADPGCRTRVFFGVGAGGLFRLRGGEWQDIEPRVGEIAGEPVVGFGSLPAETPDGDRLTMDLGIPTPPSPFDAPPEPPRDPFRFRASVARPGDTLLMCTGGLADPLRGEPELSAHLTQRWSDPTPPGLAAFLADTQVRVKGYADDRTAAAVWEA